MMRCEDCSYYWIEDGEKYPSCKYEGPNDWAPCEEEEYWNEQRKYGED